MATLTERHELPNSLSLSATEPSSSPLGPNFYCRPIKAITIHCPGAGQCSDKALAATTVANTPCAYQKYARVVNKMAADELPKHGPQDLYIGFAGYARLMLPMGASILFLRKKDSTLCLSVDHRGPNCIP